MPKKYSRHCDSCGQFYTGRGAKYCSPAAGGKCKVTRETEDPHTEWPENEKSAFVELPRLDLPQVTTLEDLVRVLEVDPEQWTVRDFTGNAWPGYKKGGGITTFMQVKARFERNREIVKEAIRKAIDEMVADAASHAPPYETPERPELMVDDPVSYWVNIFDAHLGMLAWGQEVGADYDLSIAVDDYTDAADRLVSLAGFYPVEEMNVVIGHDLGHVDQAANAGRRGGATAAGTPQDLDTRLAKLFSAMRRAAVGLIDRARLVAPVKAWIVPGNHDRETMFKLGEVLNAWYRLDDEVEIVYGPQKRFFAGYGRNAWMLTHGEEYKRRRDSLPLIFATECDPPGLFANALYREVVTGHNHVKKEGRYVPTADADETRAVRTRSLPGLTPSDAWHYESGYRHWRAATAIAYLKSGGPAGVHEFHPRDS